MRALSIKEASQISGGTDTILGTITVTGTRPDNTSTSQNEGVSSASWGVWDTMPDPPPMEVYDQNSPVGPDDPVYLVTPTLEQQKDYLASNVQFQHLADKIESLVLQNPDAIQAFYALIAGGGEIRLTTGSFSYFDGKNLNLTAGAWEGGAASGGDVDAAFHELGHFVTGIPNIRDYSDPYAYVVARAQAEVNAAIFAAQIEGALGASQTGINSGTAYLTTADTNLAATGQFTETKYVEWVSAVTHQGMGAGLPYVSDQNGDGWLNHTDQYLHDWVSPGGHTYLEWLNGSP